MRRGGLAGIGFLLVVVVTVFVFPGEPPAADASIDEIRSFFVGRNSEVVAGVWLGGLAFGVMLVIFAVALWQLLGSRDRSIWPTVSLAGAIILVGVGAGA